MMKNIFKDMAKYCFLFSFLLVSSSLFAKGYSIAGKVIYDDNTPLVGGMIADLKSGMITITNKDGEFSLKTDEKDVVIRISYVGIKTTIFKFKDSKYQTIVIKNKGEEVKIATAKDLEEYQNYKAKRDDELHSPTNVALRKPCSAQNTQYNSSIMYAFDGDGATSWDSGKQEPCYITVDFLEPTEISNIRLFTNQNRSGEALYDISVSTEEKGNNFKSIDRFLFNSSGNEVIRRDYPPLVKNVMSLRISVLRTPAIVSFSEIVVNGVNEGKNLYGKNQHKNCIAGDCYNGRGIYQFENYDTFEGLFNNGAIAANFGTYRWNDGRFFSGLFKSGNLDQGFIFDRNNNPISKVENGQTVQDNSSLNNILTIGSAIINGLKSLSGSSNSYSTYDEDDTYDSDNSTSSAVPLPNICYKCKGTGKCTKCKGTGEIPCKDCNGIGKIILTYEGKAFGEDDCATCEGLGADDCAECKGTGVCRECNGKKIK